MPAIHGTTSILNSALKYPSVRRVVITSSVVAILSDADASTGSSTPISSSSRVDPLPAAPFSNYTAASAYRASKALSLDATDRFVAEKKPHFAVVNVMPGYVIGRNELITDAKSLVSGSNALVLPIVLGSESQPGKRPLMLTHVSEVARVEIESLDENKVAVNAGESKSFLLDGGSASNGVDFDDAKEVVRKAYPQAVKEGKLKLGGGIGSAKLNIESAETVRVFGEMRSYECAVESVVGQYLELLGKE
jgi:nucleoside-diphosphate-sugar epimerase